MNNKIKSFTLSELLVVMIITVIVVGIAFTVLNLVRKQITRIEKNFKMKTELSLFEQRLWQDFNTHPKVEYKSGELFMQSDIDTVNYFFYEKYCLIDNDTINIKLNVSKTFSDGLQISDGNINGILISAEAEIPDYFIFVSTNRDAAFYMN